jgi:hypothetical protein
MAQNGIPFIKAPFLTDLPPMVYKPEVALHAQRRISARHYIYDWGGGGGGGRLYACDVVSTLWLLSLRSRDRFEPFTFNSRLLRL